jgi:RNA polymerase sigma-54 factor
MAGELKQQLRTSQQLAMSPQIQQAIKILTLGRQELQEIVDTELHENPCLEQIEPGHESDDAQHHSENGADRENDQSGSESQTSDDLHLDLDLKRLGDLLGRVENGDPTTAPRDSGDSDESETPIYDRVQTQDSDLHDALEEQLRLMHLTDHELQCAVTLLQYISDEGFLERDLKNISEETELHYDDMAYALTNVQKCEPVGVGARSLQECLLLQLEAQDSPNRWARAVLEDHWPEFEKQDFVKLGRLLKKKPEEIRTIIQWIREHLDPRPARQFGSSQARHITPDVYIFQREEQWVASINEDGLPRLRISPKYQKMFDELASERQKLADKKQQKEFVSDKMRNAKSLLLALQQRNKTILRVAEVIIARQREFLENGLECLRPLTLRVVADELQLHESTISRTTSHKYVHTPRGIFELKFFFNAGLAAADGQELANEAIKSWVAEYIKNETEGKPLSDQDLSEIIEKDKGVKVARRTVAKYREALGLMSSAKRKKMF